MVLRNDTIKLGYEGDDLLVKNFTMVLKMHFDEPEVINPEVARRLLVERLKQVIKDIDKINISVLL